MNYKKRDIIPALLTLITIILITNGYKMIFSIETTSILDRIICVLISSPFIFMYFKLAGAQFKRKNEKQLEDTE